MGLLGLLPKSNKAKKDVLTEFLNPGCLDSGTQLTQLSWVHQSNKKQGFS